VIRVSTKQPDDLRVLVIPQPKLAVQLGFGDRVHALTNSSGGVCCRPPFAPIWGVCVSVYRVSLQELADAVTRLRVVGRKTRAMKTIPSSPPAPARRATIAVPGGRATLISEIVETGDSETGDIVLQSLERSDGRCFLRLGYRRNGRLIRGPVSFEPRAFARLFKQAAKDTTIGPLLPSGTPMSTASRRHA